MNHRTAVSTVAAAVFGAAIAIFGAATASADVKLPAIFSDNMVLQSKANVWGTAAPHEVVRVKLGSRSAKTEAGADGKWSVILQRLKTDAPSDMTVTGSNAITLHNVAVGDVWLCAGASNMALPLNSASTGADEIAGAKLPLLRIFQVEKADTAGGDVAGHWETCDSEGIRSVSALAYFFGRDLHQKIKLPVGLIVSAVGATPIQAWVPPAVFASKPDLKALETPAVASKTPNEDAAPSAAYNSVIAPLIPYTIRGVVWYQGESDTFQPAAYRTLFPALITSWRAAWGEGDFPFLFMQLANFLPRSLEPSDSLWAELREAQASALHLPQTGMAVAIDIGEGRSLLPKNKDEAGRRMALVAGEVAYGTGVTGQGPFFTSMKIKDGKAALSFSHAGGGLDAKGGEPLKGFTIAAADKTFYPASAKIDHNKVIVSSDKVPKPVAIRYAWADNPDCNLADKEGLPACPFRTDTWEATLAGISPADSASPPKTPPPPVTPFTKGTVLSGSSP